MDSTDTADILTMIVSSVFALAFYFFIYSTTWLHAMRTDPHSWVDFSFCICFSVYFTVAPICWWFSERGERDEGWTGGGHEWPENLDNGKEMVYDSRTRSWLQRDEFGNVGGYRYESEVSGSSSSETPSRSRRVTRTLRHPTPPETSSDDTITGQPRWAGSPRLLISSSSWTSPYTAAELRHPTPPDTSSDDTTTGKPRWVDSPWPCKASTSADLRHPTPPGTSSDNTVTGQPRWAGSQTSTSSSSYSSSSSSLSNKLHQHSNWTSATPTAAPSTDRPMPRRSPRITQEPVRFMNQYLEMYHPKWLAVLLPRSLTFYGRSPGSGVKNRTWKEEYVTVEEHGTPTPAPRQRVAGIAGEKDPVKTVYETSLEL